MLNGCRFDIARAEHIVEFFPTFLRHSKGQWAGQPFELLDWQRDDVIMPLFGWVREDGFRRFSRAYVEIPKKNGKSTLAAGIGLYMLCGDNEAGAEVYSAASDQKQAAIVHKEAINMADTSDELMAALTLNRSTHVIQYPETRSWYTAISSKGNTKEGLNAHCVICDELHAWYGNELFNTLRYAMRARREPLFFMITTAGDDPDSICRQQHDYARGVLNGSKVDQRYFAYIRAADPDPQVDDPWSEETWRKANPSFGITISIDQFREDAEEARQSPGTEATFKRYGLNIWTSGDNPWLPMDRWHRCRRTYEAQDLFGETCCAGLDLSQTRDTSSVVLSFPMPRDRVRLLPKFWLPTNTALEYRDRAKFIEWGEQGLIELIDGDVIEYSVIRDYLNWCYENFELRMLLYDDRYALPVIQRLVEEDGWDEDVLVKFPQNMNTFCGPTAEFERRVINGTLQHNGHEVLTWQAGNAIVRTDANANKRPVKPKPNDYRKIDGIVAGIMALDGALAPDDGPSVYEEAGNVAC